MNKHTKLPWHKESRDGHSLDFRPREVITAVGVKRIAVVSKRGVNTLEEAEANAEFILRACNSHYELLETLEKLIGHIDDEGPPMMEWEAVSNLCKNAHKIITKAKEEL